MMTLCAYCGDRDPWAYLGSRPSTSAEPLRSLQDNVYPVRMKHAHIPFIAVLLLTACGESQREATPTTLAPDSAATMLSLDLAAQDMPLFVEVGDATTLGVETPTVRWNEEFGRVEVEAGDHFGITIMEDVADIARLKADLERDMLQKHTIIEEAPDRVLYRSQFPDDALVFAHFYQVVEVGGRVFVVQDRAEGHFNEADVARMLKAVRTQRPV